MTNLNNTFRYRIYDLLGRFRPERFYVSGIFFAIILTAFAAHSQNTVTLAQKVIEQKQTGMISPTVTPAGAQLSHVTSSNPSVATAAVYRVNQIQIVAVAPGKTTVSFFDSNTRITYSLPVWVQAPNATGGGGVGYNPGLEQLPQIVMAINRTQNVTSPANAPHNINSVTSSNPSVATARTNTADTIQIYSKALGDTFIEFSDNGVRYQVHVWVQNNATGLSGGGSGSGGGVGVSGIKTNPIIVSAPHAGALDKALVGRWVLASSTVARAVSGGSGMVAVIKADGSLSVDYDGMNQVVFNDGSTYSWTGKGLGHISAENGVLVVDRVDQSNCNFDIRDRNGASMLSLGWTSWNKTLGAIFPPPVRSTITYTVSGSTLTLVQQVGKSSMTFVFTRH